MEYEILPAIFEQEKSAIEHKLSLVKPFAKTIHIDLVDGVFAPTFSYSDTSFFSSLRNEYQFELHMMVDNPIQYIKPWAEAGITRFIGHVEKMPDQYAFVDQVSDVGEVGLAFDLETSLDKLAVPIYDLDTILIMTVKTGFSGQEFQEKALEKVRYLKEHSSMLIEVDGGINNHTIQKALTAGAQRFAVTSYLFGSDDPAAQFAELTSLCQSRVSG